MTLGVLRSKRSRRRNELGLLLVVGLSIVCADILASFGVSGGFPRHEIPLIAGILLSILVIQFANRRYAPDADPVLLPLVFFLNGLGYVMIELLYPTHVGQQVAWTGVGIAVYLLVLVTVKRSRDLDRYRYLMLLGAFFLLVLPLIPKISANPENSFGAKLWIGIGPLSFQPVEVAKLLLVLFFASYFVEKRELLTIPTRRVGNHLLPDLRAFGPIAIAGGLSIIIILGERDVGFSLLLFVVFLSLLWITTGRWTYVVVGLVVFALGTVLAQHLLGQVNARIAVWLDPWKYYSSAPPYAGQQPVQGELAFGRGGIFGSGLGLGLSNLAGVLPVSYSDFIFAVIGEELGLVGATGVVVCYVLMVGSGIRAALRAPSDFAKLAAAGLTAVIGFQVVFIMAGVVRLLPLTGVTLPFVSYGGSSLVANYALIALLMRISAEANQVDAELTSIPASAITESAAVIGTGSA